MGATRRASHEQSDADGRFIVVVLDLRIERVSSHATRGKARGERERGCWQPSREAHRVST